MQPVLFLIIPHFVCYLTNTIISKTVWGFFLIYWTYLNFFNCAQLFIFTKKVCIEDVKLNSRVAANCKWFTVSNARGSRGLTSLYTLLRKPICWVCTKMRFGLQSKGVGKPLTGVLVLDRTSHALPPIFNPRVRLSATRFCAEKRSFAHFLSRVCTMLRRDNGLTSGNGLHLEKDIHPCAEHNPLSNDAISVISPSTLLLPPIPPGCIVNELAGWEDGRTLGQVLSTVKYNQKWTWKDFPLRPNETKVNLHRTWLPLFMKHPCHICDLIFNNEPGLVWVSLVTICNSLIVNVTFPEELHLKELSIEKSRQQRVDCSSKQQAG